MNDTIVALSTPSGESAIAVVRLSGAQTQTLAAEIFGATPKPRTAAYGKYTDRNGTVLDDVVAVFFKAPHSYTGEDCLEISTHGNPFIVRSVIDDLIARGARAAQAGEFTRRAFENAKMDLSQAEAVALLIGARSERSLKAARKQLSGELGRRINDMSAKLLDALALIEAYIDFPEDDLPEEDKTAVANSLSQCAEEMRRLIATAKISPLVHEGIDVVIAGAPNAGKSSLLNALLGGERAIVSDIAGTTRDFISEKTTLRGNIVRLTDTAGLREGGDDLEAIGIRKAKEKIAHCDICLFVADSSAPDFSEFDADAFSERNTIIVLNKCDIAKAAPDARFNKYEKVEISCKNSEGIETLLDTLARLIDKYHITAAADDILVSARHAQSLEAARSAVESARDAACAGAACELVSADLREALSNLGDIVGKTDNEAVLDRIFSKFCIGK